MKVAIYSRVSTDKQDVGVESNFLKTINKGDLEWKCVMIKNEGYKQIILLEDLQDDN